MLIFSSCHHSLYGRAFLSSIFSVIHFTLSLLFPLPSLLLSLFTLLPCFKCFLIPLLLSQFLFTFLFPPHPFSFLFPTSSSFSSVFSLLSPACFFFFSLSLPLLPMLLIFPFPLLLSCFLFIFLSLPHPFPFLIFHVFLFSLVLFLLHASHADPSVNPARRSPGDTTRGPTEPLFL